MYSHNRFTRLVMILCAFLLVGIPFSPGTQAEAADRLVSSPPATVGIGGGVMDYQPTSDGGYVAALGSSVTKISSSGQIQWTTIVTEGNQQVMSVRETADGGYLFAGTKMDKFMYGRLDSEGKLTRSIFEIHYQGTAHSIVKAGNDGYVIAGHVRLVQGGDLEPYVVRIDNNANPQGNKIISLPGDQFIYDALPAGGEDPDVILVGSTDENVSHQGYMAKVNSSVDRLGTVVWEESYGENSSSYYTLRSIDYAIDASGQPGYVVTGNEVSASGQRTLLLFTGLDGKQKWLRTYTASGNRLGLDVRQTKEGGFAIAGGENHLIGFLYKTDVNGNLQWQKEWPDVGNLHTVLQLGNGNYHVAGGTLIGLAFQIWVSLPNGLTADDDANRIIGLDETMEYSTDGGNRFETYNPGQEPLFDGDVSVLVRYKADPAGGFEVGEPATFTFTRNPDQPELPAGHSYNQDGFGFSGTIEHQPLGEQIVMTGYKDWPSGFSKGLHAFVGGVFDGKNVWLIPFEADRVIKLNKATGEMTGYNDWPEGFSGGSDIRREYFMGGVYDGQSIWMIPYSADRVVKLDKTTGEMTGYNNWPVGFTKDSYAFAGGIYDGKNIWLIPLYADRLIKLDTDTGEMTGYNNWPDGFSQSGPAFQGGVYDGRNIWLIPLYADRVIKLDTVTGKMTGYNDWPDSFSKTSSAGFAGGIYDGENIWMIPYTSNIVIKLNATTGEMTGYNGEAGDFSNPASCYGSFTGGIYDGESIWMTPRCSDRIIRIDKVTGEMTRYTNWPSDFSIGMSAFYGSVYDGESIWMVPFHADRVVKLSTDSPTYSLTYNGNGATGGTVPTDSGQYKAGASVTVLGNSGNLVKTGYTFAGWNTAADGSGTDYAAGASFTVAGNITLYAKWTKNSNADLRSLVLSSGVLDPSFAAGISQYTARVSKDTTSVTVTAETSDEDATATVSVYNSSGQLVSGPLPLTNGTASDPLPLSIGTNTLTVEVTAVDHTKKTYTVSVTRERPNQPPVSDNRNLTTRENKPISGTLQATDADDDPLTYSIVSHGTKGTAVITNQSTGQFTYTPNPGATGTDTFTYKANDGQADSAIATVTIRIIPQYTPPPYYPVTDISLNHSQLAFTEGDAPVRLSATILPSYATNQQVTWSSSDPSVASVDQDGTVTPKAVGTAVITVTTADGNKEASCSVTVKAKAEPFELETSEKEILLKPDRSASFKVFAVDSKGKRKDITFSPDTKYRGSSSKIAVTQGLVRAGKKEGNATVTVTYQGKQRKISVKITQASVAKLLVSPKKLTLEKGETKQLTLAAKMSDGKEKDVTKKAVWTSTKSSRVEVSETGEVTAVEVGSARVRATYGGKTVSLNVTVTPIQPEPKRLTVSKRVIRIKKGDSEQVTLTAVYADGTKRDVTLDAKWTSNADAVVQVTDGLVSGTKAGKAIITAHYKNKKINIPVYVKK